jgi:hypothetical protein
LITKHIFIDCGDEFGARTANARGVSRKCDPETGKMILLNYAGNVGLIMCPFVSLYKMYRLIPLLVNANFRVQ